MKLNDLGMIALKFSNLPKLTRYNLSKDEFMALSKLNSNKNIVILKAEKGNFTVIMTSTDYEEKLLISCHVLFTKPSPKITL